MNRERQVYVTLATEYDVKCNLWCYPENVLPSTTVKVVQYVIWKV